MFRIEKAKFNRSENINLSISPSDIHDEKNTYTVIIGKNACGKSILLEGIIKSILDKKTDKAFSVNKNSQALPSNIIAISTSRFDRFPENSKNLNNYFYLGNKHNYRSAAELVSESFTPLVKRLLMNLDTTNFSSVFEYLGFLPNITVEFKLNVNLNHAKKAKNNYLDKIFRVKDDFVEYLKLKDSDFINENIDTIKDKEIHDDKAASVAYSKYKKQIAEIQNAYINQLNNVDIINFEKWFKHDVIERNIFTTDIKKNTDSYIFWKTLNEKNSDFKINSQLYYEIDKFSQISNKSNSVSLSFSLEKNIGITSHENMVILSLLEKNLVKLTNIKLKYSNSSNEVISLSSASSGQQCALSIIIGIASAIKNDSLICIDEPEISLHPQWQLDFISMLQKTFSSFSGCHFIIATHSPQIVSGLNSENGFICLLETKETFKSDLFSKMSADYQLAEVFNSPGFRNEYLTRVCIKYCSILTTQNSFSEKELSEIDSIISSQKSISDEDPVFYLIEQLKSLKQSYEQNRAV